MTTKFQGGPSIIYMKKYEYLIGIWYLGTSKVY